ncbi:hypothetical protein [uncultured Hymenobacter sp.]|uniref:hypothetical protein n=1 Tax=uncultured Hymenobacter sp. TaxID=170016 RepID=UPI0035C947D8
MKHLSFRAAFFFFLMDWLPTAPVQAQTQQQAPTPTRTVTGRWIRTANKDCPAQPC